MSILLPICWLIGFWLIFNLVRIENSARVHSSATFLWIIQRRWCLPPVFTSVKAVNCIFIWKKWCDKCKYLIGVVCRMLNLCLSWMIGMEWGVVCLQLLCMIVSRVWQLSSVVAFFINSYLWVLFIAVYIVYAFFICVI